MHKRIHYLSYNRKKLATTILLLALMILIKTIPLSAQGTPFTILPERERAQWVDDMLTYRIDSLLPKLMRRTGIDMWILISREYNEDPVMKTILPSEWLSARRRTIMVFYDNGEETKKIAIARYNVGRLLKGEWNIDVQPDQWMALVETIQAYNPAKIGLNISPDFGLADGLVHTEYQSLIEKLPLEYKKRIVSAEKLAIAWLETRSKMEIEAYNGLCALSRSIIIEAFSPEWLVINKTTTDDIVWRLRQLVTDKGLATWFHPTVSIQRDDKSKFDHLKSFSHRPEGDIIQYGDLLHVDFGITYNRLNTDQQQHFYILHPHENQIPDELNTAFAAANTLQDILTDAFEVSHSGNQILSNAHKKAKEQGIAASIYTHPIGFHGHAAGPTIGLWDQQGGVEGAGDYIMYPNTAYSIELNAAYDIKSWSKIVRIMLEEDGWFDGKKFNYFSGRQTHIYPLRILKSMEK